MVVTFEFNVRNINVNLLGGTYQRDIEKTVTSFVHFFQDVQLYLKSWQCLNRFVWELVNNNANTKLKEL